MLQPTDLLKAIEYVEHIVYRQYLWWVRLPGMDFIDRQLCNIRLQERTLIFTACACTCRPTAQLSKHAITSRWLSHMHFWQSIHQTIALLGLSLHKLQFCLGGGRFSSALIAATATSTSSLDSSGRALTKKSLCVTLKICSRQACTWHDNTYARRKAARHLELLPETQNLSYLW